jgi:Ca2+-binding RTX toxin-like protein
MATMKGTNGDDVMVGLAEDDMLYGKAGDDLIVADLGNDTLIGGAGNDTLEGALGNDTASYVRSSGGVRANLTTQTSQGAAGEDTLITIENLTGSSFADVLVGADDANVLIGGHGGDRLFGRGGADQLAGGAGRDMLEGGGGADLLIDGRSRDLLTGGSGADTFRFADLADIKGDRITDIARVDTIDLSLVDADVGAAADQAFHVVDHFSGVAGELVERYSAKHDFTKISGDTDGDGRSDFQIRLDGDHSGFDHFVL